MAGEAIVAVATEDPRTYYSREGFAIYRDLVPHQFIDSFIAEYLSCIVPSRDFFYRQSTRFQRHAISSHGYVMNPFLDIHCYDVHRSGKYRRFSELSRRIFFAPPLMNALRQVTLSQEHRLMQSMLFDMNSATPPHQDAYYLDSWPSGHLLGAWIALEDIEEKAGRFYVLPRSREIRFELSKEEKITNSLWTRKVQAFVDEKRDHIYAPTLKKGDVLFWNSMTIHGSLKTEDPRFSRKSLTAHYLPSEFAYGRMRARGPRKVTYSEMNGMKYKTLNVSPRGFFRIILPELYWHLVFSHYASPDQKPRAPWINKLGAVIWNFISFWIRIFRAIKKHFR